MWAVITKVIIAGSKPVVIKFINDDSVYDPVVMSFPSGMAIEKVKRVRVVELGVVKDGHEGFDQGTKG